jgi:hypothetical protein
MLAKILSAAHLGLKYLPEKNISELSQELVLLSLEGQIEDRNGKYYLVK